MDHGGEAARPTTVVESTDLGMAGAVQGDEANIGSAAFDGQLAAAPGSLNDFHLHREPGHSGVAYPNISEFWQRQLGTVDVPLLGLQELPADDGVVQVHGNYGYSALQPSPGAGRGMVLAENLLPDDADVANHYGYYAPQPRPAGAGHGEVLVDLLADANGHGEVFGDLLAGTGVAVHDDYGYYPWQPRPGAGRGEVIIGPLPDGVGVVFDNSINFVPQTLLGPGRADGITGALRDPNLGAVYDNRNVVAEHLRHLLPFAGIGACSVAVNGLAAGPGSPAVAFDLFALFLGGLFLVILYVLRL